MLKGELYIEKLEGNLMEKLFLEEILVKSSVVLEKRKGRIVWEILS